MFSNFSFTHFLGVLSSIIILYLFVFDIRNVLKIESKLEKKFKDEKTLKLDDQIKNSSTSPLKSIKEGNMVKGNLIRISTLFNGEKNEICDLLNNFSSYALIDKNILKSGLDNYYNNNFNNNNEHTNSYYYQITLKDKKECFRRGKIFKEKSKINYFIKRLFKIQ
jgi:hypothetical protein